MGYDPVTDPYDEDPYDLRFVIGYDMFELHSRYGPNVLYNQPSMEDQNVQVAQDLF
jgi:hypothetical protein